MADTLGTIPTGNVQLEDGRVLVGMQRLSIMQASLWMTPDGTVVVIAADMGEPGSLYMYVSIHCVPKPTEQDIALVRQAFFGDLAVNEEQDALAHPEIFYLRLVD